MTKTVTGSKFKMAAVAIIKFDLTAITLSLLHIGTTFDKDTPNDVPEIVLPSDFRKCTHLYMTNSVTVNTQTTGKLCNIKRSRCNRGICNLLAVLRPWLHVK